MSYGMILAFMFLFAYFLKAMSNGGSDFKDFKPILMLYSFIDTPFSAFSIIKGFEEYKTKADLTATHQYFTLLLSFLGSICVAGILADVIISIVVVGYGVWLGIKKLVGISSDAPIAQNNNP